LKGRPGRPRKQHFPANATSRPSPGEDLDKLPEVLYEQEIPRFLREAPSVDDLIAVSLMLFSALRVGEVEELEVEDLDFEKGELRIRAEVAKRSKERRVPMDLRTVALISARVNERKPFNTPRRYVYPRAEGLAARSVARKLERVVKRMYEDAGITRINGSPHALRHTGITQMLERKIPVETVRVIAGHEDLETTMIYTHLSTKHTVKTFQEAYGI
jgi:integrase/recombinase XerD